MFFCSKTPLSAPGILVAIIMQSMQPEMGKGDCLIIDTRHLPQDTQVTSEGRRGRGVFFALKMPTECQARCDAAVGL